MTRLRIQATTKTTTWAAVADTRLLSATRHVPSKTGSMTPARQFGPTTATIRDTIGSVLARGPLRAPARALFRAYAEWRGISASVDGVTMRYLPGTEPIEREPERTDWVRHADYVMSRAFLRAIRRGGVVADVGAFKGGYTILAAGAVGPEGEVVAFEPVANNHAAIERNLALNGLKGRVTICRKAVSDGAGTVSFFTAGQAAENSFYQAGITTVRGEAGELTETRVETIDLDTFFSGRRDPGTIKLDTEGAEFAVLRGAERILAAGARVICEMHPYAWEQAGHTQHDLIEWLAARGRGVIDLRTMAPPAGDVVYGPYELVASGKPL